MRNIAKKAIPVACVITAPFFVNANEQISDATAMLCATGMSNSKLATGDKMQPTKAASSESKTMMNNGQITPPAGPLVSNGADVFLTADFIWWKAQQDGLQYSYNGTSGGYSSTTETDKGSMHQPHFKYEPGFKVGLGVLMDHDNWDLYAQYTWLNVDSSDTRTDAETDEDDSDNLLKLTDTFTHNGNALKSEAKWGFNFNVLDVELGRNFWVSKRLTMRPHAGLKFSWMKQDYNVESSGINNSITDVFENDYDLHQFGVGVRAGLDNAFYFANKWSIFGDLAVTGLWNSFRSSVKNTYAADSTSEEVENANIHFKPHTVTTVLELDLGLRFETIFSKGRYMYMLQAGWETQVWFNQGQFVNTYQFSNPANLSLEGLTIKTGFYF